MSVIVDTTVREKNLSIRLATVCPILLSLIVIWLQRDVYKRQEWDGNTYDKDTERLIGKAVDKGY